MCRAERKSFLMNVLNTSIARPSYLASEGDVSCLQPELGQHSRPALFPLHLLSLLNSFVAHGSAHYALCVVAIERSLFVHSFLYRAALSLKMVYGCGKQDEQTSASKGRTAKKKRCNIHSIALLTSHFSLQLLLSNYHHLTI